MTRRLLLLGALLAALVAWDGWLVRRDRSARQSSSRIEHLLPPSDSRPPLAVVAVRTGAGENFAYGRKEGVWRCLSWRGALASRERIEALVYGLLDAQGVIVSEHPQRPADYGLDLPSMATVSLHGPLWSTLDGQRDLIASLDLGTLLPEGGGSFVRRHGETAVWVVDSSPGAALVRDGEARRPPLLDGRLVPGDWPGGSPRIQSLRLEHADGETFELLLREVTLSSAQSQSGVPPFEWVLLQDGAERPCTQITAASFIAWLLETDWADILDPSLAPALKFDRPRATLTLDGAAGSRPAAAGADGGVDEGADAGADGSVEPLRIVLGGKSPGGRPAVAHSLARLIYELQPEQEALLFPTAAAFGPDALGNPWER